MSEQETHGSYEVERPLPIMVRSCVRSHMAAPKLISPSRFLTKKNKILHVDFPTPTDRTAIARLIFHIGPDIPASWTRKG